MLALDCKKVPDLINWLNGPFPERCYFYPGRDCPGWEFGGKCGRVLRRIEKEENNGADAS